MQVLFTKEQIEKRLQVLGAEITKDYQGKELTIVVTLKGAFMTASTLAQNLSGKIKFEFTRISSYGNLKESSGKVVMKLDIDENLQGKNILIVEDIVDSGYTIQFLQNEYLKRGANSVKIMSLLDKPSRRKVNVTIDYKGFEVDDKFIIGYGLDDEESLRELPFVGYLE